MIVENGLGYIIQDYRSTSTFDFQNQLILGGTIMTDYVGNAGNLITFLRNIISEIV